MKHNNKSKLYIELLLFILFILIMLTPTLSVFAISKDEVQPIDRTPFFIVAALIGGTIIITLSYVSWKKYRAEKKGKDQNDIS